MKFRYIDYGKSLLQDIEKDPEVLYVFSDYSLKNNQKKESKKNIFKLDATYLTLSEFKDRIFKTDRVILNEAKRVLTFYSVMRKEFKAINIDSYFESIEFGTNFFSYYTELNRALCKEVLNLEPWQKKQFEIFETFKKSYQNYLDKHNYLPKEWLESVEYLDISELKPYKKIILIDIVNFTPLDIHILKKLSKTSEIEIVIQGEKDSFDEIKFELKEINLPKKQEIEIFCLEVQDEIELVGNLLDIIREKNKEKNSDKNSNKKSREKNISMDVYSPEAKENSYFKLFPNNFIRTSFYTINDTKFFKFLELLGSLVFSIEPRVDSQIPISTFLEGMKKIEMIEKYGIGKEEVEYVYRMIKDDYKYIGMGENEVVNRIYEDILEISKADSIDFFIDYFNKILDLDIFKEERYLDFYSKLQEYMGYAKTTELLFEKKELKNCFKNGAEILKFLLQYLNGVELKSSELTEGKILIKPVESARVQNSNESIFINTSSAYLPKKIKNTLFLTERQKKESGFTHYEKERKEEKYRFYQALLKNRINTLIYIKNRNSGEGISPTLSEVVNSYRLHKLDKRVVSDDIVNELSLLSSDEVLMVDEGKLLKERDDFTDASLRVGAHDYNTLLNCEYKFYLSRICKLESFEAEEDVGISAKFLGNFVHDIFEKVTKKVWKKSTSMDSAEILDIAIKSFKYNRKKFPIYLDNYFKEILIPRVAKNILKFYRDMEEREEAFQQTESEKTVRTELSLNSDYKVVLSGRVDLLLKTKLKNYIIDFKTGDKTNNQLDFYSIALFGDSDIATKIFYNAFEGDFIEQEKVVLTKETLCERLEEFFKKEEYSLSKNRDGCSYCNFDKICRRWG